MDAQHSAIILIASALEKETLIDMLKACISEYEESKLLCKDENEVKKAYEKVVFHCHLMLLNRVSNNSIDGAIKTMERMDDIKKAHEFFNPKTN